MQPNDNNGKSSSPIRKLHPKSYNNLSDANSNAKSSPLLSASLDSSPTKAQAQSVNNVLPSTPSETAEALQSLTIDPSDPSIAASSSTSGVRRGTSNDKDIDRSQSNSTSTVDVPYDSPKQIEAAQRIEQSWGRIQLIYDQVPESPKPDKEKYNRPSRARSSMNVASLTLHPPSSEDIDDEESVSTVSKEMSINGIGSAGLDDDDQ